MPQVTIDQEHLDFLLRHHHAYSKPRRPAKEITALTMIPSGTAGGGVEEAELDEFVARSLNEEFPWPPRTRARRDYRTESGRASEGVLEQHSPPAEEDATLEWPAVRAAEVEAAKKEEAEEGILEGVRALAAQSGKTVEEVERDLREAVRALGIQQEAQKEAQEEARSKARDRGNGKEVTKR